MPIHNINGQQIHAVHEGKPGRQVALLIHGWSSSWYAMSPLMPMLAQRFSCIAVDLPGYGESPPLPKRATIPDYAELLAKLIEEVSDGPVVLIGHSMGGMISATLAMRYPVLVERIVMLCPTISGKLSNYINIFVSPITLMERFGLGSVIVSATEKIVVGITDQLMRPASFSERTGITQQDYMRLRADARRPGQGRVRAECFGAMRANNLVGKIGKVEPPALVIWGAEDNTVPLRDASVIADEWPNADLRIIPKAGHWPHFETPDATRRLVAAFLGLPLMSSELNKQVDDNSLKVINEVAQFLAHSDVGNNLNQPQRTRLAAQCQQKMYRAGDTIVSIKDGGNAMYIVQDGTVEVWSDPENPGQAPKNLKHVASLTPGQITGELAMLDGGMRSADLRAGPQGATMLLLERERLLALCEDDSTLGSRVLWNIATAMALRVRFILWQLQRALQKANQAGVSMDTAPRSSYQNQASPSEKAQKVVRTP
ncbi:MAG: alpha/beta fold hydrolase [Chloroflexi bacterium]|nr:alpha/beta fold hydrolase [Chloroflexota bacterium]